VSRRAFKWVHNYFVNYGRDAVSEGLGSRTLSEGEGFWTQPTAMRGLAGGVPSGARRFMDPALEIRFASGLTRRAFA
jgi:hypothetical protein